MNVEVEDEDTLDARLFAQPFGDARDRVEEAEAHGRGAFRVMARWSRDDECTIE